MKTCKRALAVLLVFAVVFGAASAQFNVSAAAPYDYKIADWDSYWAANKDDNTKVSLSVGADETQMNFSWHAPRSAALPKIRISKSRDMSNSAQFIGYFTCSENADQQVNRVTVKNLEENTVYYYSCYDGAAWSEAAAFQTGSRDTTKFMFVSDIQCMDDPQDETVRGGHAGVWQSMLEKAIDKNDDLEFIVSAGDQTHNGNSTEEWIATLSPKALRSVPLAAVPGNHDNKSNYYNYYVNNPNNYYGLRFANVGHHYYFRNGDVLFLMLNSNDANAFGDFDFVKQAVAENQDAKWRVMVFHHDIYGTANHASKADNAFYQVAYSTLIDNFDIDVVLNGHDHVYGRSYFMKHNEVVNSVDYSSDKVTDPDGTLYVTANSASGRERYEEPYPYDYEWLNYYYQTKDVPLYSVIEFTENQFVLKTYRGDNNEQVDAYTITKTEGNSFAELDESQNIFQTGLLTNILKHYMGDFYIIVELLQQIATICMNVIKSVIA